MAAENTLPKEGQMTKQCQVSALALRLLDHAREMPEGSLMAADFAQASKLMTELLDNYEFACVLVARLNDAIQGDYKGDPVGPLKDAMAIRSDAERYHWLRRNITRLIIDTERQQLEDGGVQSVVSGLITSPSFSFNANPEFFDTLVDAVRFDEATDDGEGAVREVLPDSTGRPAPALRLV